jgi:hypothetical protein
LYNSVDVSIWCAEALPAIALDLRCRSYPAHQLSACGSQVIACCVDVVDEEADAETAHGCGRRRIAREDLDVVVRPTGELQRRLSPFRTNRRVAPED